MPSSDPSDPYEITFARLAISVLDILARDMDDAFHDLAHRAGTNPDSPLRETAEAAERIVSACGRLVTTIRHYQHCDTLRRIHDEQHQEPWMQEIPF
jgi:hypothetical protein